MADRFKVGYMNYDEIADRLSSGKLNIYDSVYTKDTEEIIFIKPDGSYIRTKSRIDIYNSVVEAEAALNQRSDTYIGQLVGILDGQWIKTYNVNYADNKYIIKKIGVSSYSQLDGLPSINGNPLIDNYDEEDPTVPNWAKTPNKPEYTAYEVGAVDKNNELALQEIDRMFEAVFGS